jgi:glycerate kinase
VQKQDAAEPGAGAGGGVGVTRDACHSAHAQQPLDLTKKNLRVKNRFS